VSAERWAAGRSRKSLDARDKDRLQFVYAAEVALSEGETDIVARARRRSHPACASNCTRNRPSRCRRRANAPGAPPVVVGSGPGGLAAAYFLAEQGYRPLVLEPRPAVSDRIRDVRAFDAGGPHDPESNYLFGEGGAGTFSDGKLTCRGTGPDVRRILQLFADCKGKPSVVYGTGRTSAAIACLPWSARRRIEALVARRFSCRVEDFDLTDGRPRGLATSSGYVPASVAILATGHSARHLRGAAARGVPMVQKPFQMGVRVEHPQETVNRVQYGPTLWRRSWLGRLQRGGTAATTSFPSACAVHHAERLEPGFFATNGMSLSSATRHSPTVGWW
jgi:uncharacterized FAD-dependent dehydrogenase